MLVTAPGASDAAASGRFMVTRRPVRRPGAALTARAVGRRADGALRARRAAEPTSSPARRWSVCSTAAFAQRYAVRHVATYGRPDSRRALRAGQPLDQEMIDRLRSLGM